MFLRQESPPFCKVFLNSKRPVSSSIFNTLTSPPPHTQAFQTSMELESNSFSTLDFILQARLLVEIILHPISCSAILQNWHSFCMTQMPEKLMYFTSAGWVDLPTDTVEPIKRCFERRGMATKVEIQGIQVVANLLGMVLVDSSGRMRSIAWIDSNGKPYFPRKVFGGSIRRAVEDLGEPRPSFGSSAHLTRLEDTSVEYKKVRNTFLKGLKSVDQEAKVSAVYSCIHASAFGTSRLRAFQRMVEITKSSESTNLFRYGWYGANFRRIEAIITRGFGLEDATCGAYGAGIYFSPRDYSRLSACYSKPDADGEFHVLLCRVILGRVEKITPGSKQYAPSTEEFDNGINDTQKLTQFIIWTVNMSTHILPQYIVSFKVSQLTKERWRRFQSVQSLRRERLPTLIPFRNMETSLPRRPQYLERYFRNKNNLQ